jgi:hypothetical protein
MGLVGCSSHTFAPDTTTLKYGQTGQDGDGVNGDYDSNNFAITQTFKWSKQ